MHAANHGLAARSGCMPMHATGWVISPSLSKDLQRENILFALNSNTTERGQRLNPEIAVQIPIQEQGIFMRTRL